MFSSIKSIFGFIEVSEDQTMIHIKGMVAQDLLTDINNVWKTSKVGSNLFCQIAFGGRGISLQKFFGIEILYIIDKLMKQNRMRTPRRVLEKIRTELLLRTWLGKIEQTQPSQRFDYSRLKNITFDMLDHQMDFIRTYEQNTHKYQVDGYLLAAAPGSGKTLTCIGLHEVSKNDVFIAVSPLNALQNVWEKTMSTNIVSNIDNPEKHVWVSKTLGEQAPDDRSYYAFHYDALDRAVALAKKLAAKGKTVTIALDECHNINNPKSLRAQLFEQLCKITKSKDIVWSSGTPIKAIGSECVVMLRTIAPDFNKICEDGFRKIFGKDSLKANDILAHRLGLISFKVNKGEIVKGEVVVNTIKVTMPNGGDYTLEKIRNDMQRFIQERTRYYNTEMPKFKKFYDECLDIHRKQIHGEAAEKEFQGYLRAVKIMQGGYDARTMVEYATQANRYELGKIIPSLPQPMRNEFKSTRSVIKYVKLKIMGEALGGVLGKSRAKCHVDMLDYIDLEGLIDNAEKKTIIFTSYVEVVNAATEKLKAKGYKPMVVHGGTTSQLNSMVKEFANDPDLNPCIATYQSLSTAVPMIMANNIININQPFRDHEREQSISRCNRLGQDRTVYVNDIMLDTGVQGNVSTRSKDILEWSKAQVESIMGIQTPSDLEASLESMANCLNWANSSEQDFVNWVMQNY